MISPMISAPIAFALVSFCLGELGDGLNIFQGIYLVGIGWNEGAIGIALSLMGLTALIVQTIAGDIVDKTKVDRRLFLSAAAFITAASASAILFVHEGNVDHFLIYTTKVVEGIASSFIAPCLAALTLANFGPDKFDSIMAMNVLWGHIGSVVSALLAGTAAYVFYPNIKYCFFVIGLSALIAIIFVRFLPEGDPLLGRGFKEDADNVDTKTPNHEENNEILSVDQKNELEGKQEVTAASYLSVIWERKTLVLCITGFFFHFANANVLLVLGELMGGENDDGSVSQSAIPLTAGAIVLAQATMSIATIIGDRCTEKGVGRKTLFIAGLVTLPLRCALIIFWKDAGEIYLLSTQILDGLGGGFFGLMHPYLVADITFGTGRFNVIMGLTASCFGLGGTMSNFFGQMAVEKLGHVASLSGSFIVSFIPILIFAMLMPETMGKRGHKKSDEDRNEIPYYEMT